MSLVRIQTQESAPLPSGVTSGTDLLLVPERVADRLRHFSEEVFDLSAESHLVRFLKVLLGDAGVGQLRKRYLLARLQQTIQGSHFYDLDRFYGALFDARRRVSEVLAVNPYVDTATGDVWEVEHGKDASYRSRMNQLGRAVSYGASPIGMELAAEAVLNTDVDLYESFVTADADATVVNRREFVIRPKRPITMEEAYDLRRVLYKLKPADARLVIDAQGAPVFDPIEISRAWADSTYWEIVVEVAARSLTATPYAVPSADPVEQPRPPFSAYQGEAWSYNGDILGIAPYTGRTATPKFMAAQRIAFPDGTFIDFPASNAVLPQRHLLAGRAVSDAILLSHPFAGPRVITPEASENAAGQTFQPVNLAEGGGLAPLYADRILVDDLNETIRRSTDLARFEQNPTQRFWLTPERHQEDGTEEVLEVRLRDPRLINYFGFEVAHFPHVVAVEAYDVQTSTWNQVFGQTVFDSIPSQITPPVREEHPYHSRPDHWVRCTARIDPVETDRLRVVLRRTEGIPPTAPPRTLYRNELRIPQPVPYSLALRNLDFGYRVTDRTDVPDTDVIATSTDALGSTVQYRLREQRADNLVAATGSWKCEPQPVSYAVVNFFLDVRDLDSEPRVIDRFFLDPTHAGPHLTIYHSNDKVEVFTDDLDGGTPWTVDALAIDGQAPGIPPTSFWDGGLPGEMWTVQVDGGELGAGDGTVFDSSVDGGGPLDEATDVVDGGIASDDDYAWTPIAADYTLQKGYVRIPPTRASFFKFEFTNLVAEPYESFLPITRRVKVFPAGQVARSAVTGTGTALEAMPPGANAALSVGLMERYSDAVRTLRDVAENQSYTPTEALFATDPSGAERLREQSWAFGFHPWHLSSYAPRFTMTEQHLYEEFDLRHTTKVGFFVGLKAIEAYRLDPDADDDAEVYVERFWDDANIEPGFTWNFDPGAITSPDAAAESVMTSKVMRSQHDVIALQFATQQSPAAQLVPDDDLRDPALGESAFDDEYEFHKIGDAQVSYLADLHSVRISRYVTIPPRPITMSRGLVQPLPTPTFAYRNFEVADLEAEAATFGGFETGLIVPSGEGRVYAAARVFLETDLTSPLKLQIISVSNGEVLVEREMTGRKGEMLEWLTPYDMGTFFTPAPPVAVPTYRSGFVNAIHHPIFRGTDEVGYEPPPPPPPPTDDSILRVRVVQEGKSNDAFRLDTLSLFDESIVWEFSNDGGATFVKAQGIRNHVYGVLSFPEPGNELVWRARTTRADVNISSLKIRPWYEGIRGNLVESTQRGPNVSAYDLNPPIQHDPEFNTWQKPIPRSWYFESRKSPGLQIEGAPNVTPFQRFYGRPAFDDISGVTDEATFTRILGRSGADSAPMDDAGFRQGTYSRQGADAMDPVTDEVYTSILHKTGGMVEPPIHPI